MSIEIVADKYGSAMFELAQEQNILELMEEQLGYVAEPITADVEASVQAKLREVTGKDVILSVRQDLSIMGGIIIQVGDKRIDGSVSRRLEELEKSLLRTNSIR